MLVSFNARGAKSSQKKYKKKHVPKKYSKKVARNNHTVLRAGRKIRPCMAIICLHYG